MILELEARFESLAEQRWTPQCLPLPPPHPPVPVFPLVSTSTSVLGSVTLTEVAEELKRMIEKAQEDTTKCRHECTSRLEALENMASRRPAEAAAEAEAGKRTMERVAEELRGEARADSAPVNEK